MFQFENKYFFWVLCIIPVLIIIYWLSGRVRKKVLNELGETHIIKQLYPGISKARRSWKFILFLLAFTFIAMAMINPQVGTKLETVESKGADLMICLDISNSMMAEDLQPNRLERAKLAISKLIDKLRGDRIGLIIFAGEAYVQLPITTDYAAAKMFLESVNTSLISTQGTAIGSAIELAVESFGNDEGNNKAILIITDGENHEEGVIEATNTAAEKGITIHTVGIGSPSGSPIPIRANGGLDYRKDKEGNTVITKLNEEMLMQIASAGNGVYVRASNNNVGLNNVMDSINSLEKKQYESKLYSSYEDRFQWFVAPALLLLLIELLLSEKKSRLAEKLNLFGDKK